MQENHYQKHMYVHRMDYVDYSFLEQHRDKEDLLIVDRYLCLHHRFYHLQPGLDKKKYKEIFSVEKLN
jgi:hypothetical protein